MQSLQPFHTFALPVQARKVEVFHCVEQLKQQWHWAVEQQWPVLILGQGSNVLFLQDFQGLVLINQMQGKTHRQDSHFHYLHVQAGENWHQLVEWSLSQGIYGLENLALIPGCVGSAPIQNIGAYGVEFKDICDYVELLNLHTGQQIRLNAEDCAFGYRESVFKQQYQQGYVIIAVGLKLAKAWKPQLQYGRLANLDQSAVSAAQIFAEVCAMRQSKLPDPAQWGNAGSFFKNPVIEAKDAQSLLAEYPQMPHYPQTDGRVKLAAGWLIEQCGLKGYQVGGASVHQQQALVLINKGGATSSDVVELAHHIRQKVAQRFAVWLQPEVRFIGENGEVDSEQAIS